MDLVEINRISKTLASISAERENLEKKKAQMQKRFEKRMAKNQEDIDELQAQSKEIEKLRYFKREEIMPVIAYLVSLIEKKTYYYMQKVLPLSWDYRVIKDDYEGYNENQKIRIVYICHNREKAKKEIEKWINNLKNSSYSSTYEKIRGFFLAPKDSYVQINIYNNFLGGELIRFINNMGISEVYYEDCHICYEETTTKYRNYLQSNESHIRDERFIYIIDFMEYLVGKRYEKESHELTQEEIFGYADEFAREYNRNDIMRRIREHQNQIIIFLKAKAYKTHK